MWLPRAGLFPEVHQWPHTSAPWDRIEKLKFWCSLANEEKRCLSFEGLKKDDLLRRFHTCFIQLEKELTVKDAELATLRASLGKKETKTASLKAEIDTTVARGEGLNCPFGEVEGWYYRLP